MLFSVTAGLDFSAFALDSSGSCGANVTYTFDDGTGTLTISGTGKIGDSAFSYNNQIKNIVINYGITGIEQYAFYCCAELKSISIPNSVKHIDTEAFAYSGLTSITIPNSITTIGDSVFCECSKLKSVTLPNTLTDIFTEAFWGCISLTSINIPASTIFIHWAAFYACSSLKSINVNSNNKYYYSKDGVLFERATKSLYFYPYGKTDKSYTVPNGIKEICIDNPYLTKLTIPVSVLYLDISSDNKVKDIYYAGTKSEYKKVEYGDFFSGENVTIHYLGQCKHNFKTTIKKATLKKNGSKVIKCTKCGKVKKKETILKPTDFYFADDYITYNGKVKKPKLNVYDKHYDKINKKYYTVKYPKAKKIGTYTVKVRFKGNYKGTKKLKFKILPRKIKKVKTKAKSQKEITVSWKKVKGVDGYRVYRNTEANTYNKLYKTTKSTSITIPKISSEDDEVYFYITTYKKVGNKIYESEPCYGNQRTKLSAPKMKIRKTDFGEFVTEFKTYGYYQIQISNNKNFSKKGKNKVKSCRYYTDSVRFYNWGSGKTYFVRARKYYYSDKGDLIVGPWCKTQKVKTL